jgi:phosphoribosyl 1,2-cyclic phosphodiesterase
VRISVLGSGSGGNAILVETDGTRLLVDAGFSARDLARRLHGVGLHPDSVDAIVVTHDHGDHTRGMGVFARRHQTPLYITDRTRDACATLLRGSENTVSYEPGRPFRIGAVRVEPFLTAHDAADPVGVALVDESTGLRLGVATDLGRPTAQTFHALAGSDFLVLEANHDEGLLHGASYPWSVKSRIGSSHGHLSNGAAARLAVELLHPGLAGVVLAHLSGECNRPDLARSVVGRALFGAGYRGFLGVATQGEPTPLFDVASLRLRLEPAQLSLF